MSEKAVKDMSAEERLAYHLQAEEKIAKFKFEAPPPTPRPKQVAILVNTDLLQVVLQVVKDGGENNLHYHTAVDEGWMVMSGRARFYGPEDVLLADLGPREGVHIPAGARYRFEKSGPEDLQILQMMAYDRSAPEPSRRYNVEATKHWMVEDTFKANDPSMAQR